MDFAEMQEEEILALNAIYDGDSAFSITDKKIQYRFGEDGHNRSFLLTLEWPDSYPSEAPRIDMDSFYNYHVLPEVKSRVAASVQEQIPDLLDTSMTFTLIEHVRDNLEKLLEGQPEQYGGGLKPSKPAPQPCEPEQKKVKPKKEHLTKAQKRRIMDRGGATGERERGWNWVNVIRHLHQTGSVS